MEALPHVLILICSKSAVCVQKLILANKLLWGKEGRRKRVKRGEGMGKWLKELKGVKGKGGGRGLKSAASVWACLRLAPFLTFQVKELAKERLSG